MISWDYVDRILENLTFSRTFTQKEVELARARIPPTDSKRLTGFLKWKDIKRWHTTWHVHLCTCFILHLIPPSENFIER